mmetsp:Transcript_1157/g.4134  ORF Transcript_1157/g.4134 Transcript_1157/m.4134 type:complete len:303 (+) Transcript_1157:126-1034(+)
MHAVPLMLLEVVPNVERLADGEEVLSALGNNAVWLLHSCPVHRLDDVLRILVDGLSVHALLQILLDNGLAVDLLRREDCRALQCTSCRHDTCSTGLLDAFGKVLVHEHVAIVDDGHVDRLEGGDLLDLVPECWLAWPHVPRPRMHGDGKGASGLHDLHEADGVLHAAVEQAYLARHRHRQIPRQRRHNVLRALRVRQEGGAHAALDAELLGAAHVYIDGGDVASYHSGGLESEHSVGSADLEDVLSLLPCARAVRDHSVLLELYKTELLVVAPRGRQQTLVNDLLPKHNVCAVLQGVKPQRQ